MRSLNSSYVMASFSIFIIALALTVCEAKYLNTQTSLNPKSYHHHSLNTHILNSKNDHNLFPLHYKLSIHSINSIFKSSKVFNEDGPLSREMNSHDTNLQSATTSCRELLSLASYNLNISLLTRASAPIRETLVDFKKNLCGTLAYIDTCLDIFKYAPKKARNIVAASLNSLRKVISNSLSILSTVDDHGPNLGSTLIDGGSNSRKSMNSWAWPPSWMSSVERKLLLDSNKKITVNVVVAKDGTGMFKTISEAMKFAPQNKLKRFVIHVKQGKYFENVKIDESKWNILMFGDGMDKTIVSGKLGSSEGATTVQSATFAVYGRGFVAINMGFENTAGPSSKQAVAVLSTSDKSVFYKCSITGYQDTLFSATGRQFYRECRISGTIDFIFGMSSAVFQSCTILVRRPLHGQANTITAQGRTDPRCLSGFSIHKSTIAAAENLAGARTFLGRPWRRYSTVVVMESQLDRLIDPQGWTGWKIGDAPPNTVYYGEYGNYGLGSAKGLRRKINVAEARRFTVRQFIGGAHWLPGTGVPFQPDL